MSGEIGSSPSPGLQAAPAAAEAQMSAAEQAAIRARARDVLKNLPAHLIDTLDAHTLKLLVQRAEAGERLAWLVGNGFGLSQEANSLREQIKFLDELIARIRELDQKFFLAAVKAWKAAQALGSTQRLEAFLFLGLIESVSGLPVAEVRGVRLSSASKRSRKQEEDLALAHDPKNRLKQIAAQ